MFPVSSFWTVGCRDCGKFQSGKALRWLVAAAAARLWWNLESKELLDSRNVSLLPEMTLFCREPNEPQFQQFDHAMTSITDD
jgi:hypothetical protein